MAWFRYKYFRLKKEKTHTQNNGRHVNKHIVKELEKSKKKESTHKTTADT